MSSSGFFKGTPGKSPLSEENGARKGRPVRTVPLEDRAVPLLNGTLSQEHYRKAQREDKIEKKIHNYFDSSLWQEFDKTWQKYKGAFENSIRLTLLENFGRRRVNVFEPPHEQKKILFEGLFFNDNIVRLLVKNLTLQKLPFMRQPDVTFNLPNNELRVDAALSTIIIEAQYLVFRNRSSVVYTNDLDPQKQSPFSATQVHTSGMVTIVANDCTLNGNVLTRMSSTLVILLQDFFKVQNCRFYVEIYQPGSNSPPVIAPYFSLSQGNIIERILTPTIKMELLTVLQGALTATVNTSAIFQPELFTKIRAANRIVFRQTVAYLQKVVSNINRHTREHTEGIVHLKPLHIAWDDGSDGGKQMNKFSLENMTLFGMDTAYSSSLGGPYRDVYLKASDHFRFSTMQVRGQVVLVMSNNGAEGTPEKYDFTLSMRDFGIDTKLNCDFGRRAGLRKQGTKHTKGVNIFEVLGWRAAEFSIMNPGTGRFASNALAIGYLNEEVPEKLVNLFTVYEKAVNTAEDPDNDQSINHLSASTSEEELNNGKKNHKLAHLNMNVGGSLVIQGYQNIVVNDNGNDDSDIIGNMVMDNKIVLNEFERDQVGVNPATRPIKPSKEKKTPQELVPSESLELIEFNRAKGEFEHVTALTDWDILEEEKKIKEDSDIPEEEKKIEEDSDIPEEEKKPIDGPHRPEPDFDDGYRHITEPILKESDITDETTTNSDFVDVTTKKKLITTLAELPPIDDDAGDDKNSAIDDGTEPDIDGDITETHHTTTPIPKPYYIGKSSLSPTAFTRRKTTRTRNRFTRTTTRHGKAGMLLCRKCDAVTTNPRHLFNKRSPKANKVKKRNLFGRQDVIVLTFGILEVITAKTAICAYQGPPYNDDDWFPGYTARHCHCRQCGEVLGWTYEYSKYSLYHDYRRTRAGTGTGSQHEKKFHVLRLGRIKSNSKEGSRHQLDRNYHQHALGP